MMFSDDDLEQVAESIGERIEIFFSDKKFVWETPRTAESLDSQNVRFKI